MQNLVQAVKDMKLELAETANRINGLQDELTRTQSELVKSNNALSSLQTSGFSNEAERGPKLRKPVSFQGKGSISSWITHYGQLFDRSFERKGHWPSQVSYLEGSAHEWVIGLRNTEGGLLITTWSILKDALRQRFEALNKVKIARDKLSKWIQLKDVASFNEDFQQIILDIPGISVDEQIDRYCRGLKSYIWKEMCTKEYKTLQSSNERR